MIDINERFSISYDGGWQLHERLPGRDKDNNPKVHVKTTYPGQLWVCLARIVDACGSDAQDIAELRNTITHAVDDFRRATRNGTIQPVSEQAD